MAGRLESLSQRDFSGGVNLAANPYSIGPKQLWRCSNFFLDEHGSLRTRSGIQTLSTGPVTASGLAISVLSKTDTTQRLAIVRDSGRNVLYNMDTNPWSLIDYFTTSENTPISVQALNQVFFAPGYETPRLYDGSTLSPITAQSGQTVPLGAKHAAFHYGSIWLWNTAPTSDVLDGPSSLRISDVENFNSWPSASQAFISRDDGQVGMGMATFTVIEFGIAPISTLVLFKTYSTYQVTGTFGSSNFSIQQVKSDMGCIAPRTIQFVSGLGILRLTHKGFALFDGVNDRVISEEIRPAIFGSKDFWGVDEFVGVDFDQVDKAWAGQVQNPPLYIAALPVKQTPNLTRIFVFDLVRKCWYLLTVPYNLTCITTTYRPNSVRLEGLTTAPVTSLRLFDIDLTTDDGTKVNWLFRVKPAYQGSPTTPSYWREVMIDMLYSPGQSVSHTIKLHSFLNDITGAGTLPIILREDVRRIKINRITSAIYAEVSGSGVVRVRDVNWLGRMKPPAGTWSAV